MNILKNVLFVMCFSLFFCFSNELMADDIIEPNVITLNNTLKLYETSKHELLRLNGKEGFDVSYDHKNLKIEGSKGSLLFDKICEVYRKAKSKASNTGERRVYEKSDDSKIRISLDVSKDTIVNITVDY